MRIHKINTNRWYTSINFLQIEIHLYTDKQIKRDHKNYIYIYIYIYILNENYIGAHINRVN